MHYLALANNGWSYGGSILTFLLPMIAFSAVVLALLFLYTKPEAVPGSSEKGGPFPIVKTRIPGEPAAADSGPDKSDESASAG